MNQSQSYTKITIYPKRKMAMIKIAMVFLGLILFVWTQVYFENKPQNKPVQAKDLPIQMVAKSLRPDKYLSDEEVKELFCRRVCSASASGRWDK